MKLIDEMKKKIQYEIKVNFIYTQNARKNTHKKAEATQKLL